MHPTYEPRISNIHIGRDSQGVITPAPKVQARRWKNVYEYESVSIKEEKIDLSFIPTLMIWFLGFMEKFFFFWRANVGGAMLK